ncbi:NAD(P)H-dependent oxidoreductase [Microbacterium sp. A588]
MLDVVVLVGHPTPNSRSRLVGERLVDALLRPIDSARSVFELATHKRDVFSDSVQLDGWTDAVSQCDLLVVATPTFNAGYSGLLKAFFDRGHLDLGGVTAIPVMTGGTNDHALAASLLLAPLLLECGASVPGAGVFLAADTSASLDAEVEAAASRLSANLANHAVIGPALNLSSAGLAAASIGEVSVLKKERSA